MISEKFVLNENKHSLNQAAAGEEKLIQHCCMQQKQQRPLRLTPLFYFLRANPGKKGKM